MEKNTKIILIIVGVFIIIPLLIAYCCSNVYYSPSSSINVNQNSYDLNKNTTSNYNTYDTSESATSNNNTYNANRSSSSSYNTYDINKNTTNTSTGCQFKYSNGAICGRAVGSHSPLCDYHFNQLNDTYNSLVGK